jgi:hypothetical protein
MPTGYTATLHDGEQSFTDFALTCARAFGALIELRDSSLNADIPDKFEVPTRYAESLEEARRRLADLLDMSDYEANLRAKDAYNKAVESREEQIAKSDAIVSRYAGMRRQVEAWEPPTPDHVEMRTFMLQQLDESISFDGYHPNPVTRRTGAEWLADEIAMVGRTVAYRSRDLDEAQKRAKQRTAWVAALKASLADSSAEQPTNTPDTNKTEKD